MADYPSVSRLPWMVPVSVALHVAGFGAAWAVAHLPARPAVGPALAGDTMAQAAAEDETPIESPEGAGDGEGRPPAPAAPAATATPAAADTGPAKKAPSARAPRPTAKGDAPSTAGAGESAGALYGAVGDRSATDLATAFTRAFPQAASTDPAWASAPFGDAGAATVTLTLDEAGKIEGATVGGAPSAALRSGVARTLQLVKARVFVAHGKTTVITLAGRVSPDEVHDGLHGDVFAIGASLTGSSGQAFFALAIGRRVDVTVTARSR